jgi:hypothetical protein
MPIKFFSFGPDNHYAYPEIVSSSDNPEDVYVFSEDDCRSEFIEASYSVIDYDIDESDKPNEEDFEDEEEYEAAYEEWVQNLEHEAKESAFGEYGNYDVYEYLFMISLDPNYSIDTLHSFITNNIDDLVYDNRTIREKLMEEISREEGVKFILCTHVHHYGEGNSSIARNGLIKDINRSIPLDHIKNSEGDILKIMAFLVIDTINKGDISLAGSIIASVNDFIPGLEDYIKTQITEEEYQNLKISSRSHGILGRFK